MNGLKYTTSFEDIDKLVEYCKSFVGNYFTYHSINSYRLTLEQIKYLQNKLIEQGYIIRDSKNSHGVDCFWVLKK